jgi:hypothetical protein
MLGVVIFQLQPPEAAGPLLIGATGNATIEILRQLGDPQVLCKTPQSRPAWGVFRPSGLFISTYFDVDDRLEAIEFATPHDPGDAVTYDGRDVFTTPAADLVAHLRRHTTISQEENGHAFTAYDLLLSFWRQVTPDSPDHEEGRFFDSVLIAQPGYYDNPAKPGRPTRE